jgi:hypothetical protein
LCATVTIDTGQIRGCTVRLRGECTQGEPLSSHEGKLDWISINQLTTLPLVEDLPILLEHILAMRKGEPPLAAHYFYDASGKIIVTFYR